MTLLSDSHLDEIIKYSSALIQDESIGRNYRLFTILLSVCTYVLLCDKGMSAAMNYGLENAFKRAITSYKGDILINKLVTF